MTNKLDDIKAKDLIQEALTNPGQRLAAYSAFHRFSARNADLAMMQLVRRGIEVSPIKTFEQWKEYGRSVKKGEKAIALLMPMIVNVKEENEETGEVNIIGKKQVFVEKNYWFALSQIKEYKQDKKRTIKRLETDTPKWDSKKALKELKLKLIDFNAINGNAQGYTSELGIAINPLAEYPVKTLIHEIAHNVLGHVKAGYVIDREEKEVEAEMVTYLVITSLGLEGLEYSRHYIQGWLGTQEFSETSAQKCVKAANKILDAGKVVKKSEKKLRKAA